MRLSRAHITMPRKTLSFVIGRKKFLFAWHPNGANAAATLYSLIETA
jgi:hypothetical protein